MSSILLGMGDGDFAEQVTYPLPTGVMSIAADDLDGDDDPDLVIGGSNIGDNTASLVVFENDGSGVFQQAIGTGGPGQSVRSVSIGDFNGDGRNDIAALQSFNLQLFTNVSTGNLGTDELFPNVVGIERQLEIGDFNRDGVDDIVVLGEGAFAPLF